MPLFGPVRVWYPGLFHSNCAKPETDGKVVDGCWFEDATCFALITQGEMSMVTENHEKGGKFTRNSTQN
jgi:hypothetical protein